MMLRKLLSIILVIFLALSGLFIRSSGVVDLQEIVLLLKTNPLAPILFVVLYTICVLLIIPTLPLNLVAGMLWGTWYGGLLTTLGAGLGAILAFSIIHHDFGRFLVHQKKFDSDLVKWLTNEVNNNGWKLVAFIRLNPVFPTGPVNYILGFMPISFTTYSIATFVFLFPASVFFAGVGNELGSFAIAGEVMDLLRTIIAISLAITIAVILKISGKYYLQKRIKQETT